MIESTGSKHRRRSCCESQVENESKNEISCSYKMLSRSSKNNYSLVVVMVKHVTFLIQCRDIFEVHFNCKSIRKQSFKKKAVKMLQMEPTRKPHFFLSLWLFYFSARTKDIYRKLTCHNKEKAETTGSSQGLKLKQKPQPVGGNVACG